MGVFSPSSASGVSAADSFISSISNTTLTLTLANTEYSFTIPAGTKAVLWKCRDSKKVQYAYTATESGTNYATLHAGTARWTDKMKISTGGLTVYVQSATAGVVLEIEYYS